jgi:molybdopterin-binding protein
MFILPGKGVKQVKLSARNQLKGKITDIKEGPVSTEVTVAVGDVNIVSSITTGSARQMKLTVDDEAYAVIKASSVMIAKE